MFKSIRQSMAWLHSWIGLVLGWFMLVIFITGTTAYYKDQINLWAEPQIATTQVDQKIAMQTTFNYLQDNASDADEWYINLATPDQPFTKLFWIDAKGFNDATLDANTGEQILLNNADKGLGDFLYLFHFQLHGVNIAVARMIMSFIAFAMLIVLISGVITHKKIFTDFFTLRLYKNQRSWLDVHNLSSVIALPFFFMITITGFLLLFNFALPQGMQQLYGVAKSRDYFNEIREVIPANPPQNQTKAEMNIPAILAKFEQTLGNAEIKRIVVNQPNTSNATIIFEQSRDNSITLRPEGMTMNAVTTETLPSARKTTPLSLTSTGVYGLHLADFAQPIVRLALFFSGVLGCVMIASGLLLWSIKRQIQNKGEESIGQYVVDRFNAITIIGLPIAIVSAFYAVRWYDIFAQILDDSEIFNISYIQMFFTAWLASFTLAILLPQTKLWIVQMSALIGLCLFLPIFNLIYLLSFGYIHSIADYWIFFRVDIMFLILGIVGIFFIKNVKPIQNKVKQKIEKKLQQKSSATSATTGE